MLIVIRRKEGLIKLLGRHSFRSVSWRTSFQLEHNGADIQVASTRRLPTYNMSPQMYAVLVFQP